MATGVGFQGSSTMRRFIAAGVSLAVTRSFLARDWTDDTALAWAAAGIEASDALLWRELGIEPGRAGILTRSGRTAIDVTREYWRAGVALADVAGLVRTTEASDDAEDDAEGAARPGPQRKLLTVNRVGS